MNLKKTLHFTSLWCIFVHECVLMFVWACYVHPFYVGMKLGVSIQTYKDRVCQAVHIELQNIRKLAAAVLLEIPKDARAFPT